VPVLRHVNKDHVVPELQLLEGLYRLVVTIETMDRERRLAAGSCMADRLGGRVALAAHRYKLLLRRA
jgi:hypothetical protein